MNFEETKLKGAFIIDLEKIGDERGFFARAFCANEFLEHGINDTMVQANMSTSKNKGTLRGMHFQVAPHQEGKLVRCIKGALFDVIIDLRVCSDTYMEWFGVELNESNGRALYVPKDFAHGFVTLTGDTTAFYMVSQFYTPAAELGVCWNDPSFNIDWPIEPIVISDKDKSWPNFEKKCTVNIFNELL